MRSFTHTLPRASGMSVALVALAALVAFGFATPLRAGEHVDEDYRLRLKFSKDWQIFNEAEAKQLVADAIAGARVITGEGMYGVIVAEQSGDSDLAGLAQLLVNGIAGEDTQVVASQEMTFQGCRAFRIEFETTISGMRLRFVNTLVLRDAWLFQILAWGAEATTAERLMAFAKGVELLDGDIRGRSTYKVVANADGIGWRVRDGVFESAVYGIRTVAPEGLGLAVGVDLASMSDDAEVGLVSSAPELYVTVTGEWVRGVDHDRYVELLLAGEAGEGSDTIELPVAGEKRVFQRYSVDAPPVIEFLFTAFFVGDRCLRVEAWYVRSAADAVRDRLRRAFAAIEILDESDMKRLSREMEQNRDDSFLLDAASVLRSNKYCNFDLGITWTAPSEDYWRLTCGPALHESDPDALLRIEAPRAGIYGTLYGFDDSSPADEFHEDRVAEFLGEDAGKVKRADWKRGELEIRSAEAVDEEVYPTIDRVVTVQRGASKAVLSVSGTVAAMRDFDGTVRAMIDAIELPRHHPATELDAGGGYVDHRFGFSYAPPGTGWTHHDATPEGFADALSQHQWKGDDMEVVVTAMPIPPGSDPQVWLDTVMMKTIRQAVARNMGLMARMFGSKEPERSTTTVAGTEAAVLRWKIPAADPRNYVILRNGVCLWLLVVTDDDAKAGRAVANLRFLE